MLESFEGDVWIDFFFISKYRRGIYKDGFKVKGSSASSHITFKCDIYTGQSESKNTQRIFACFETFIQSNISHEKTEQWPNLTLNH
jgi:hypothetical protein